MPNRIIKDSIRTNKSLNLISDFQFRLWTYLITYVDDFGRGSADPEILKGVVLTRRKGITEKAISDAMQGLANTGLIRLYYSEGEPYFCFPSWDKHQQMRAKRSKFPAPDFDCKQMISDDIKFPRNPIQSESNPNPIEDDTLARSTDLAAVMFAYMDKITATPSERSLDELKGYVELMGAECCLRAIDAALDAKAANWNYIRKILQNKAAQGVRCLADWERLEEQRRGSAKNPGNDSQRAKDWSVKSAIDDYD